MEDKNLDQLLAKLGKPFKIQRFNPEVADYDVLDQMISAHQLKYLELLIQSEEENRLLTENFNDLLTYPEDVQTRAIEMAPKAKFDPEFFVKNNVDEGMRKPIMIVNVIESKRQEAEVKTWQVEYHARLVDRLRSFKKQRAAYERLFKLKKTLLQRLLRK